MKSNLISDFSLFFFLAALKRASPFRNFDFGFGIKHNAGEFRRCAFVILLQ